MAEARELRPDDFPGLLADIARLAGVPVAVVIARRHGGRRLYIPQPSRLKPDHELSKLLGRRAAQVLAHDFGGQKWEVPSARTVLTWYECRRLRSAGLSWAKISRKVGIGAQRAQDLAGDIDATPDPTTPEIQAKPGLCPTCGRSLPHRAPRAGDPRQGVLPLP